MFRVYIEFVNSACQFNMNEAELAELKNNLENDHSYFWAEDAFGSEVCVFKANITSVSIGKVVKDDK